MPRLAFISSVVAALLAGCILVARPARPCPGGQWVDSHTDRDGIWHAAHWRCPGLEPDKR